jgi:hypothetical protein
MVYLSRVVDEELDASTAITWTHLHNPGFSVRGTLTLIIPPSHPDIILHQL